MYKYVVKAKTKQTKTKKTHTKKKNLSISVEQTATRARKNDAVDPDTNAYASFHCSSLSWANSPTLCVEAVRSGELRTA